MKLKSIIPWKKGVARQSGGSKDPSGAMDMFQRRVNDLAEEFLGRSPFPFSGWGVEAGFVPSIDVSETEKEVLVTVELPGIDKKDVEVILKDDMLTVKGGKVEEKEEDRGEVHHSECRYGYFERSVGLPSDLDVDKLKARFKHNVLKVRIPKSAEAVGKGGRKIELEVG